MSATCSSCKYWEKSDRHYADHECRRMPPIMVIHRSSSARWTGPGWPDAKASDWCGEYRPRTLRKGTSIAR
ncbi:MAG: hypothetical protein QOG72_2426 [Sphingomonadales bacterium]|jgi:hypothetical protein|nr:hypothetical protein [Sphingomonadales bacterium]